MKFKQHLTEARQMSWNDIGLILQDPKKVEQNRKMLEDRMKELRKVAEARKKAAERRSASFSQSSKMKQEARTFEGRANAIEKALK